MASTAIGPQSDTKQLVTDIVQRRDESRKWLRANLWDELTEVYRAIKCRTAPVMKEKDGKKIEDKSRTNVCMPDISIIHRRNTARMTAQPYRLRYIGGSDPMVADMLSALAAQQYDRSRENWHDRRIVMMSEAFGFGYSKLYWDTLSRTMTFRKAFMKGSDVVYRDRASVMRSQGAGEDEINGAVSQLGPELNDQEVAGFIGKSGNEIKVPQQLTKYEGPCLKSVFSGDLFISPNVLSLDDSDYAIEQYTETDLWLRKQVDSLQYCDDETGQMVQAFDPKAAQQLLDLDPEPLGNKGEDGSRELKEMFEMATGKQTDSQSQFPKRLRVRKRFDILEQHALEDDGRVWITWVAEQMKDLPLGRMPYPWDLYGKYAYTEMVPLPDMINAYGDSTPRLLRYLHAMHNLTVGQNFDYITQLLRKFMLRKRGVEIDQDVIERGQFRELQVSDLNGIQVLEEPPLPAGAFEREAQIMQMMGLAEPALNNVESGTQVNPNAGKTATTAILASKAADALTQFKLDGRDLYLRELGQKKLWMNQQAAQDPWNIEKQYWNHDLHSKIDDQQSQEQKPEWALSDRNGKTVAVRLDPLEIQEDIQVEPEAGSYLAVDDDLRRAAANDLEQVAMAAPGVIDQKKVIRFHLSTIRGIGNPDDYILPDNPNPPPLQPKVGINVSVPLPFLSLPHDMQNEVLAMIGMQPSQELALRDTLDGVQRMSKAADAASNLAQPANPAIETPGKRPSPKTAESTQVGA